MGYDEEDPFEDPLFSGMALSGVREPEIRDQAWREAEVGAMPEMRLIVAVFLGFDCELQHVWVLIVSSKLVGYTPVWYAVRT